MIQLKQITWDNFWDLVKLKPKSTQEKYVKPVTLFMAQSYINLKENYPDESLAIYNDDTLIGFTKIVYVPKSVQPYELDNDAYMIDALIIDNTKQGKGYGRKALVKILDYCKTYPYGPAEDLTLVCYEENLPAQSLFSSFNFHKVKETNKDKKMSIYSRHL